MEIVDSPLVSIVIPTYNGAEYLEEAIESVLQQSYSNFEIIITDDCSTDGTGKIANRYTKLYNHISFFESRTRKGIGGNWNIGVQKCKGKYIKVLCQDDLLVSDCLMKNVSIFETKSTVSLLTSYREHFGKVNEQRTEEYFPSINVIKGRKAQQSVIEKGNWIGGPSAVMFRNQDVEKIGLFNEQFSCNLDIEMWIRLLSLGDLFVIPEILFRNRIHSQQETNNCARKLGFERERIQILSLIRKDPAKYGKIDVFVTDDIMEKSIYRLLKRSFDKKEVKLWETFSFAQKFISFISLLKISTKVIFYKVKKKMKL